MKNISISILNVKNENLDEFLNKLDECRNLVKKEDINVTIHFDVMDNEFVPNFGVDIETIKQVKKYGYYIDTHLMVNRPVEDGYIDKALAYGSKDITIHYEIPDFEKALSYLLLKKQKDNDIKIGIAINPNTSEKVLEKYVSKIDKILVMSVYPGFGGQEYITDTSAKIENIKKEYENTFVQVDGGIKPDILHEVYKVDSFVVGSYLTTNEALLNERLTLLGAIIQINSLPREADINFESRTLQIVSGGYGEGQKLLGIRVPLVRKEAKYWYRKMSFTNLEYFLKSNIHDYRRFTVFCLTYMINATNYNSIKTFIDKNIKYINNWDLVDSLAPICIGKPLLKMEDNEVYNVLSNYTKSSDIWIKRIGIVSLLHFAKSNRYEVVFKVLDDVFFEEYHLIQKANGWVLRELYKLNEKATLEYLISKKKIKKIPSILKSYATEKMTVAQKQLLK